jgi:tetratricopeptide (TPR) repeat protein
MLDVRTEDRKERQFAVETKLPLSFEGGNPFAFKQLGAITEPLDGEKYFTVHRLALLEESSDQSSESIEILERQLNSVLKDLRLKSRDPFRLNNAGVAFLNAGKWNEAREHLRDALALAPNLKSARANLARLNASTGRLDDALAEYRELSARYPKDPFPLINMAQLHLEKHEFEEAEERLNTAIKLSPRHPVAHNNRALIHLRRKNYQEAISDLRVALRYDVRQASIQNNLGVAYLLVGSTRKAVRAFKAALVLDPVNDAAIRNLAEHFITLRNPEGAIELLRTYVAHRPKDIDARSLFAKAYFVAQKYTESTRELMNALRLAETTDKKSVKATIFNNLGLVSRAKGDISKARDLFEGALALQPSYRIAWRNLADLLLNIGHLEGARKALDKCLALDPNDARCHMLFAVYHSMREEYEESVEDLRRAIEINPRDARPYAWLASVMGDGFGNYAEGIRVLEAGLRLNRNDARLLNNLAYSYLMLDDVRSARKILDKVDDFDREVEMYLVATRGLLLMKEGNEAEGRRLYNAAARLAKDPELRTRVIQKKELEIARQAVKRGDVPSAKRKLEAIVAMPLIRYRVYRRQALALLQEVKALG